jgi:DNA topoisomerase-1
MGKNLVIVESPAKAKTIGRYLGDNYRITASVGHIRDLPSSTIGVDVKQGYKPRYITMKGKEKVIRELKEMAADADRVYIATDPDREGEAIAWHIAHILKIDENSDCRITFNEITETAVKNAISSPRPIDMNRVNSQQARRILDRLVGYELSPLLWRKVRKGLSAGRVQSVATRMVVQREREIKAFVPEEYWLLTSYLKKNAKDNPFRSRYHGEWNGKKVQKHTVKSLEEMQELLKKLDNQQWQVLKVKKGKRQKQPNAPFTTSTLQQEASRYMGFTSKRTMSVAQQLYEGVDLPGSGATALVTYIRTDSVRVSPEASQEAKSYIISKYGEEYLPKSVRMFKNKNASQDAHEAIRPAHFDLSPDDIREKLTNDQYRLYKLVWDKFMASQMAAAVVNTVTADITASTHLFRVSGETIVFPGWLKQYGVSADKDAEEDNQEDELKTEVLPELKEGDVLILDHLKPEQKFTQPPARYTEASLIKAMEEQGIGRPSTYAPTISTILDRNYVEKDKRHLLPTDLGTVVTELLEENFDNIVDVSFTAGMEENLDTVESGQENWVEILDSFYPPFHQKIENANENLEHVKMPETPTGEKCPECNEGDLVIKEGRYGKFIACSNYPECKFTKNVEEQVNGKCPLCGSGLAARTSRKYKRKFYTCDKKGSDPECGFISWDLPIEGRTCEVCGSYMVWKRFRGRSFPKCGNRDCPTNQKKATAKEKENSDEQADENVSDNNKSAIDKNESKAKKSTNAKSKPKTKKTKEDNK